jgi:hypothetical protein
MAHINEGKGSCQTKNPVDYSGLPLSTDAKKDACMKEKDAIPSKTVRAKRKRCGYSHRRQCDEKHSGVPCGEAKRLTWAGTDPVLKRTDSG